MVGQTLAHYRIVEKIGSGGMGEVYRATDTKLGRDVALKVLPDAFARDPNRLARFQREAQLLASLNHPHIAAIYGLEESDGVRYLVLELVPGKTLAERLAVGPFPVEEALGICRQIAGALEAAHERGILHRDLKPGNVKVTPEGKVKVLDFGLAKAFAGEDAATDLSQSPTISEVATRTGVLLGTAAYMSPEQARGKTVDKRTDIWAFGCVLYEALTARRAFPGETVSDTVAAVLKSEPEWTRVPAETPSTIQLLLHRCLQKDPSRRVHDIADAGLEIEEALATPTASVPGPVAPRRAVWRWGLLGGLAGLLLGGLTAAVVVWNLKPAPSPRPPTRFTLSPAPAERLGNLNDPVAVLSSDGAQLVYVGVRGQATQLYLRSMNQLEVKPLPGTEGAELPFFSPDGQWVGFYADGKLKKASLTTGSVITLCEARWGGASWAPDDTIIFAPEYNTGLFRVSSAGGSPQPLTTPAPAKGEFGHWWPEVLPGGKAVLFTIWTTAVMDQARIGVLSLDTGETRVVLEGGSFARYAPTGHLVFARENTLLAAPFDMARLQVTGAPVPVLEGIATYTTNGIAQFGLSPAGSLVYVPARLSLRSLVWMDRQGKERPALRDPRLLAEPQLSPDGQRVALTLYEGGNPDIWIYELARGTWSRLTFEPNSEFLPVWTPDSRRVTFIYDRPPFDLYWKPADGSGPAEPLWTGDFDKFPSSWSPDSRLLAFTQNQPTTRRDIWVLPLEGERQPAVAGKPAAAGKPRPFLQTPFDEQQPVFSPDGRWLAYVSNESGRSEVYVQPFPGPGGKIPISTEGGREPVWARTGRELFYLSGNKLMLVPVATQPTFSAGTARLLFELPHPGERRNYAVSPDGQRFLLVKEAEQQAPAQLHLVLDWFEELKRRVPTGKN